MIEKEAKKRIDAFIKAQPGWAGSICNELRKIIHKADKKIVEDWKWGPNFNRGGMVCGFGSFKGWVTLVFFQGAAMKDSRKLFNYGFENEHNRSIKLFAVDEVKKKEKAIVSYVKEAVKINLTGKKVKHKARQKKPVVIPPDLKAALQGLNLLENFKTLPYYMQRDYVEWITSPKRMETRIRRIERLVDQVTSGKDSYMKD